MASFHWPDSVIPRSSSITLADGSGRFVSPFTGTTRTVSRPGTTRLKMSMAFGARQTASRGALHAFLTQLEGGTHRVYCRDHSYSQRGSFPASELIGNVAFASDTGWTSSNAEMTLYAVEGELRLTRTGVAADRYAYYSQITNLTSGAAYVLRAIMLAGKGVEAWALRAGSTAGNNDYLDSARQSTAGYYAVGAAIGSTTAYVSIYDYYQDTTTSPITTRAIGNYQRFQGVSLSRCFLVNGASQTGSALIVDALPVSSNGLLLPGDQIQVGDELKIVTAPLNSDSGGNGYLHFAPSLRTSPANNAPVIVYQPQGKFLLAESETGWANDLGPLSSSEVTLTEAVD